MLLKLVEYHWAEHLDDALLLLGRLDIKTVPLAGGTYLLGQHDSSIQAVVDLRDLDLAYLTEDIRGLHIGAMTTLHQLAQTPLIRETASGALSRSALASSPSPQIRNVATIGGTLGAWGASQADLLGTLVALDAEVVTRSSSQTHVNLSGGTLERPGLALSGVVFKGKNERRFPVITYDTERRPNELILEVVIPPMLHSSGASFQRLARTASGVALLHVSAFVELEHEQYKRVRVVFGGLHMPPMRVYGIERLLEGQPVSKPIDQAAIQASVRAGMADFRPPDDPHASSGYRRVVGMTLAARALEEALQIALWRSAVFSERTV